MVRTCRFPYAYSLFDLKLATTMNSPARISRRNSRLCLIPSSKPITTLIKVTRLSSLERPLTAQFQALLNSLSGYFSTFPRGTKYSIDLGAYLALEVSDPHLSLPIKVRYSGKWTSPFEPSPTGLSPSLADNSKSVRFCSRGD